MAKYKIIPSSRTIVQSPISIGHKAEKGVEAIEFDLTAWVETYGSGTLTVIMRRWGDAIPYPIALEIDENNKATWTLSDIDTAKAGMAYAQLNYIVGDEVVKKSDIYTFRVMDSLTGEGEPPEAYESWLEHLTHFAAEAMAEVLDIEGIVTDKTLTVDGGIADAKATGDALSALEDQFGEETDKLKADLGNVDNAVKSTFDKTDAVWNLGTLNTGTGEESTSNTRVRSGFIPVTEGTNISLSGNASCLKVVCFDKYKGWVSDSEWIDNFTVLSGVAYVRLLIRKTSSSPEISEDEIPTQVERCNIVETLRYNPDDSRISDNVGYVESDLDSLIRLSPSNLPIELTTWEVGSITATGEDTAGTTRLRIAGYISVKGFKSFTINVDSGYKYYCHLYDDNNNHVDWYGSKAWNTDEQTFTDFGDGTKLRILLGKTSNARVYVGEQTHLSIKYLPEVTASAINALKNIVPDSQFNMTAGTAHSSTKNRANTDIAEGQDYYVIINTTGATMNCQLFYVNDEGTSTSAASTKTNGVVKLTATTHIKQIGLFIAAPTEDMSVEFYVIDDAKTDFVLLGVIEKLKETLRNYFVSSAYNDIDIDTPLASFASLFKNGSKADSFMFFTDPHIFPHTVDEEKIELAIGTLEQVFNNSSASFVMCGGDWLTASDTQDEACRKLGRINGIMRAKFGDSYIPILGNHDTNYQGIESAGSSANSGKLPQEALVNMWFANHGKAYYEYKANNSRIYVFDTGTDWETSMTSYRWEQVDWFADKLIENDDVHSVIALHIFTNQFTKENYESDQRIQSMAENLTLVAQAYNAKTTITLNGISYDFTGTIGKVAYLIGGHAHYDLITEHNDIPVILTTTAGYTPSFDLIYVDYDNSLLSAIRCGDGSNRTMTIVT